MLNDRLNAELNEQINAEFYSSYLYLSMAGWLSKKGLPGFEHWMKCQAQEELDHAIRFFNYVNERGGTVTLKPIKQPEAEWESPLHVFEGVCEHEALVTGLVNDLMNTAVEEKDFAAQAFLQWFVMEQVEEEAGVGEIYGKLKLIGDAHNGLFMLDRELEKRVFVPSTAAASQQ